jgi:hypothetical protein
MAPAATFADDESCAGEAAFCLGRPHALVAATGLAVERAGDHLAHAVARDPGNLAAHVQRIGLWITAGSPGRLFGAMIDLALALGTRGRPLRERMLLLATPALHRAHAEALRALLDGVDADAPMPAVPGSVLNRAHTGTLDLVRRDVPAADVRDPLLTADDYVHEGNVGAALALLDEAIAADPARTALASLYAELCVHSRDAGRLDALAARIDGHAGPAAVVAEARRRLAAHIGSRS